MTTRNETTRLFYNKWLYKISLHLNGIGVMRYRDVSHLNCYFNHHIDNVHPNSMFNRAFANKEKITQIGLLLSNYKKGTFQKRIEGDLLDLYTNDTMLIKHVEMNFSNHIRGVWFPNPKNINQLQSEEKAIFVKQYPHKKYKYRVYLKPHCGTYDKKNNFITWLAEQGDKTTLSKSITNWFLITDINWDRRYVLIEDESLLLLMRLHSPEFIGTIYKFVIKDK